MLPGHAKETATRAHAKRFQSKLAPDFYSDAAGLAVSSIGLGTYLGDEDAGTDRAYEEAIGLALAEGINHLDAAVNYRSMASERALGRALAAAVKSGLPREAVLVATKGGYVPQDVHSPSKGGRALLESLLREKKIGKEDLVKGSHCLAPGYMEAMLALSLANLGVGTIDVYYLHNPETQLQAGVPKETFYARCRGAFTVLEAARKKGTVSTYGTATWSGYRRPIGAPDALDLERLVAEAKAACGSENHGFRWVQLPVNLAMPEAVSRATQKVGGEAVTLLEAARRLGVSVAASGSIAQGELAAGLPGKAAKVSWPEETKTDAQRALLFTRSTGVATALVGMSKAAHVRENLAAGRARKLAPEVARSLAGS